MSYAALAACFLVGCAAVAVLATVRRGLDARWWLTTAVTVGILVVLTVVFDSVMIWADLFRFDEASLLGVRLWRAPVEDLAWPLAAGLLLPSLRELLTPPTSSASATPTAAALDDGGPDASAPDDRRATA